METLQRTANRGSISTGYDIDNSLKNESNNGERFQSTNLGTPTSVRTFTFSMWVKRTELAVSGSQSYLLNFQTNTGITVKLQIAADSSTDSIYYMFQNSSVQAYGKTKAVFRDTSAWMHIVWRVDTTQSTEADRVRIYVNGVNQELESGGGGHPTYPNQNYDVPLQTTQYLLGYDGGNNGFCGYVAEYVYADGQSLAPTEFGETDSASGIWIPKDVSDTTFGNAGYYLDFADASALGKDVGNSKGNFPHYGGSAADQATDTPTNNFCIGNALVNFAPGGQTLTEGATKFTNPSAQNWQSITGTFGLTSGKWYWEFKTNGTGAFVGIADVQDSIIPQNTGGYFLGYGDDNSATTKSLGMYSANGVIYNDNSGATGNSYGTSDIVGVALDMDNEKIYFAVNNTYVNSADPSAGTGGATWNSSWSDTVFPAFSCAQNNNVAVNYGGYTTISISSSANDGEYGTFEYAPPSGYYALCTKNLAEFG